MNCVERYLAKAAGVEEAKAGQDLSCKVSYVAAHDVTAPIAIDMFRKIGVKNDKLREFFGKCRQSLAIGGACCNFSGHIKAPPIL